MSELIGRERLERIVRRAAELQAGERDIGEGLTRDELIALGKDVGIPAHYLQQAMLEDQTRAVVVAARGPWAWLTGPATVSAGRVVPGERATVERALSRWMEESELLQVKRRYPDRVTWEAKAGAFASIQRAIGSGGRRYALTHAGEVAGQVTQLEPGFCHVQLAADVQAQRRGRIGGAAAMAAAGVVGTAAMLAGGVFPPLALLPIVLFALGATPIGRAHVRENGRLTVALEQVLDRLEHGEIRAEHALPGPRPSAFGRIADEVLKLLESPKK